MASQASFLLGAVRNFRHHSLAYSLGRFATVRRIYGASRGVVDRFEGSGVSDAGETLFAFRPDEVKAAVAALRKDSVYASLRLPTEIVAAVRQFADEGVCRRERRPPVFSASDVRRARLPNGDLAILADVLDAETNPAVRRVADEPFVLAVISQYLGYRPRKKRVRLIWSFAGDASEQERLKFGQTVLYHFDVESYNFVYTNYYLTDVDSRSGAHTMIVGSHDDKPVRWLFGSAQRSDAEIRDHYAPGREITIEGPAGFGFIQDASCYHRALAPIERDRLMLQIRYS